MGSMMLRVRISSIILAAAICPALLARDPAPSPVMKAISPGSAKANEIVTITGDNLGKELVNELYLSDRTAKTKVNIVSETNSELKFKVPSGLKSGKYWIVVLVNQEEPTEMEQAVQLVVK